jgi:periplasmic protein TonB
MPPAVMVELAPSPPAAPVETRMPEPAVEPMQPIPPAAASERQPPEILPAPIEPPPPPPPDVVEPPPQQVEPAPAEVALPKPPPVTEGKPLPRTPRPPQPVAPPIAAPMPPQQQSAPSAPPPPNPPSAEAATNWQSRLLAHLTRYKRYPASAQMRREQGVALLRVTMTHLGAVTGSRLERSSGHQLLDQEVLDLIQRAQPLPPMAPEMTQQTVEIVVPIRFELH